MANIQSLSPEKHSNLKVVNEHSSKYEDSYMSTVTFPSEIRQAQSYYPIFLQKDSSTGDFLPVILLGFKQGENLYQTSSEWLAPYIPLSVQRTPFSIGRRDENLFVNIDIEHAKISEIDGNVLFDNHGGFSSFLNRTNSILEAIHHGMQENKIFMDVLDKYGLIEPFSLEIELNNGSKNQLIGFYTINEDKLNEILPEEFLELRGSGYLETIYMMLASQSQISRLVALKNQKISA